MKIVVIGSGGREHALIKKLKQSAGVREILAIPGNGGMQGDARCVPMKVTDLQAVVQFCVAEKADYVVVAPDDPLAMGMVDMLADAGIPAFGPNKAAARIEASKVFAKDLMKRYHIPTAGYEVFTDMQAALLYLRKCKTFPLVVKADGLALGKGVLICQNLPQAETAVKDMMQEKIFGKSGSRVVVEQFITGPEVSVLAFCDGKTLVPMVSSMDHKRALDGDEGTNTGGMGTVAPNPCYTPQMAQRCMREIFLPTVEAMQKEGAPFKGCLYFGLMLCANGPTVIEYNCRFGDPETQVVLPLLQGDLLAIMRACTNGTLTPEMAKIKEGAAACVVMASGGYPQKYNTGLPITGIEQAQEISGVEVYHAGTRMEGNTLQTAGGRVLGVTASAPTLKQALDAAYAACEKIQFKDAHYRTDIGKIALQSERASIE